MGEDRGGSGPPTPGVQPPYPRPNFSPLTPPPFFPYFFFSGTPAPNSDFRPRPAPIWRSPPAHFSLKATLPPTPYLLGPQPPMSSPTPLSLIQFWSCSAAFVSFSGHCNSFAQISGCIPGGCIAHQVDQSMCATLVVISLKGEFCIFSCDQAAIWLTGSVRPSVRPSGRPSVRPSVCHTFFTLFPSLYHHEISRSYYHGQKWCPCKRSRSEVKGQGHRGQHPT